MKKKNKIKVAIIGATSFVGENLLFFLTKKNIKIIATYNSSKIKKKNKNITWKKLDIRKKKTNFFEYLNYPDIVINLVWMDIPKYLLKKHYQTFIIQKKFNHNLIENGLKNLIVLGTCYEYGKVNGRVSEKLNCKPLIPYGLAKLKLLNSILDLKKKYNFKFAWLRPFFVYGYNSKRKTLYSIVRDVDKGKKINLQVCGKLVRDFLPIDYLCKIILKLIKLNRDVGILNVCSGKKITIKNFIKKILNDKKKLMNINMNAKNPNFFEPNYFWGDTKKLKKILSSNNRI